MTLIKNNPLMLALGLSTILLPFMGGKPANSSILYLASSHGPAYQHEPYHGEPSSRSCPITLKLIASDAEFDEYYGDTHSFHGGYPGYVGKYRAVDHLYPECFYDHAGALIDEFHPDAKCAGSADEYKASGFNLETLQHWLFDQGGPVNLKKLEVTQYALDGFSCRSHAQAKQNQAHT